MGVSELDARASAASAVRDNTQVLRELIAANRIEPDPEREIRIRDLRLNATAGRESIPEPIAYGAPALGHNQLMPTCSVSDLSSEVVRSAFAERGCLYVPGVLTAEEVEALRNAIDDTQEAHGREGRDPSWHNRPRLKRDDAVKIGGARDMAHRSGGCLAVDSPRAMFQACEMLERHGLINLAQNYLGEPPIFSASKFMLWRVPGVGPEAGWHQDGRFLGDMHDIKSLNIWTALTDCGGGENAPGMELVLENLDYYVMPAEDSHFNWSVSDRQVDDFRKRVPVVTPRFKAGDMLLFDHWLLHRTWRIPGMTAQRYAIESWLFAPSAFPGGRLPMSA